MITKTEVKGQFRNLSNAENQVRHFEPRDPRATFARGLVNTKLTLRRSFRCSLLAHPRHLERRLVAILNTQKWRIRGRASPQGGMAGHIPVLDIIRRRDSIGENEIVRVLISLVAQCPPRTSTLTQRPILPPGLGARRARARAISALATCQQPWQQAQQCCSCALQSLPPLAANCRCDEYPSFPT